MSFVPYVTTIIVGISGDHRNTLYFNSRPSDVTLIWNVVFEPMVKNEPTTNTRSSRGRQQSRKRKELATGRDRPSSSKASKKAVITEDGEPEFEDSEDSKSEKEEKIQFNDTKSEENEGGGQHNHVDLDQVDEN
ncbi:hypothetical protein PIB30_081568 [Stylosanthes scabra]|uniref:Uncharacterized protein n=1 Tax=Stylosanthes scabra TaxID=79078 RepID=A0ABU6SSP8_9FABA|nr:hypothetical protein [Stylosanthes scabra]